MSEESVPRSLMLDDVITCEYARVPVIWVKTYEESRAMAELLTMASLKDDTVWIWSATSNNGNPGWEVPQEDMLPIPSTFDEDRSSMPGLAVHDFVKYCSEEANIENRVSAVFKDVHNHMTQGHKDINLIRSLRDASINLKATAGTIICIAPVAELPEDLVNDVQVTSPKLPDREIMKQMIENYIEVFEKEDKHLVDNKEDIPKIVESCEGLTIIQADNAVSKSYAKFGKIDIDYIRSTRAEEVNSIPGLTFVDNKVLSKEPEVGGLDELKKWLKQRSRGFSPEAKAAGIPNPKGALFIGVPGTGKTLTAKNCARYFNSPLIRLSLPLIKGGIVGSTEQRFQRVRDTIDSMNNAVIHIDELEKSLPQSGAVNHDGGASDVILSGTLELLQERKEGTFVLATANNISRLPPELLRKGRWDAIFFVDLPNLEERVAILNIHLKRNNRDLDADEVLKIASHLENFSGAEIEAAIIGGMWEAFDDNRSLTANDVIKAAQTDPPLYKIMEDEIKAMREWARTRARMASTQIQTPIKKSVPKKTPKKKGSVLKNIRRIEDGNTN